MGKGMKTKAGRNKAPRKTSRWAKGQSCLSNPEVTKFRDASSATGSNSSNAFFQQFNRNSLLTQKNLEGRGSLDENDEHIDDDILSDDIESLSISDARTRSLRTSASTFKSFASNWSQCSNGAFEKFLGRFRFDSSIHKEMLSILAATTEVISSVGGSHRETEYFASFIRTLETVDPAQYHPLMALLSIITGKVSDGVLIKTFPTILPLVNGILNHGMESFDSGLIRVTCDVLKKLLAPQDPSNFTPSNPQVQSVFYTLLQLALHDNPKVRRKARLALGHLFSRQKDKFGSTEALQNLVVHWTLDQLNSYPASGPKVPSDTISLLTFLWTNQMDGVSESLVKKVYEGILRVMSGGEANLLKIGFRFYSTVFQNAAASSGNGHDKLVSKLISGLWSFRPDWRNSEGFILWIKAICDGIVHQNDTSYLPLLFEALSPTWASFSFGKLTSQIVSEYLVHILQNPKTDDVDKAFKILSKNLISLPPNENVIHVLNALLQGLGNQGEQFYTPCAREILLQLTPIQNSTIVLKVLENYVTAFGIEVLWNEPQIDIETKYTQFLPLLRNNLSHGSLAWWKSNIFPLLESGRERLQILVWESFIGFCRDPIDPDHFPAELIGKTIQLRPKIRLRALIALRQFAQWPQSWTIIKKYAKNYIPLLFNLYIKEKQSKETMGHADALGTAITEYLPRIDNAFVGELMKTAITKYHDESTVPDEKGPILDLITMIASHEISTDLSAKAVQIAGPLLEDTKLMKRSYRLLLILLKNEFVEPQQKDQIVELLRQNAGKAKSNAEPLRLECINWLVLQKDSWFNEFLPEVILNSLSVNTKARKLVLQFIESLSSKMKELPNGHGQWDKNLIFKIEHGLHAPNENPFIISSTIHFLTLLQAKVPPQKPIESFFTTILGYVGAPESDPDVCREGLKYISSSLSIFKGRMGPYAAAIGTFIMENAGVSPRTIATPVGKYPRKEINKILARMIKIFGEIGLRALLPGCSEDMKMNKRIKNIKRKLRKLKEDRQKKVMEDDDSKEGNEESEDEDSDEGPGRGPSKAKYRKGKEGQRDSRLVIREGAEEMIDFLDPRIVSSSLINKPKETKSAEEEFSFSADGKLIIELPGNEKGKSSATSMDEGDSDLESDTDDKPTKSANRKRKHPSGTSSVRSGTTSRSKRTTVSKARSQGTTKSYKNLDHNAKRPKLQGKRRKLGSTNRSTKGTGIYRQIN